MVLEKNGIELQNRFAQSEGHDWRSEKEKITNHIHQQELALLSCCMAEISEPNCHSFRSLTVKRKSETATVKGKRRERCMQTAKGRHMKKTSRKVIRCYSSSKEVLLKQQRAVDTIKYSNKFPSQLFTRMETVLLLLL